MSFPAAGQIDARTLARVSAPPLRHALDALLGVEALVFDARAGAWLGASGARVEAGTVRTLVQMGLVTITDTTAALTDSGVVIARHVLAGGSA